MNSATVQFLLTWPILRLARELYQHARENAALRNRAHEVENELFWMKAAESDAARRARNREAILTVALEKIITMNRQEAEDRYGCADKAESWSCVRVCREAIAAEPAVKAG